MPELDPYYYAAYPATCVLMWLLGRSFVFFVKNNLPFPEHQPRPILEEVSWGIFACGVIQYLSGVIYHLDFLYRPYAILWLLGSAGLFLVALVPGGVWSVYAMRREFPKNASGRGDDNSPLTGKKLVEIIEASRDGLHEAVQTAGDIEKVYKVGKVVSSEAAYYLHRNGE